MNRAYAQINLAQLVKNLVSIRSLLKTKAKVLGIVKADAYGHGAVSVAKTLVENGVDFLGVAWVSEAEELRKNQITVPILILSEPAAEFIDKIIEHDLVQTVYSLDFVRKLNEKAQNAQKKVKVHVKVDTGMRRIGVSPDKIELFWSEITNMKNIEVEGVFTHFACADQPEHPLNQVQISLFKKVVENISSKFARPKYIHAANSAATKAFPEMHFDFVRVGIALYQNVMTFKSRVIYVKEIESGASVSYGARYIAPQKTKVATISVGYADGLPRSLTNQGSVLINGQVCPLIGTICMDMCMADVTKIKTPIEEEVVLIGQQGEKLITAKEVADLVNTIDYEIMCGISKRVPRLY